MAEARPVEGTGAEPAHGRGPEPEAASRRKVHAPTGRGVDTYERYHIEVRPVPEIASHPTKFRVKVRKHKLAAMILREVFDPRTPMKVGLSRPGADTREVRGLPALLDAVPRVHHHRLKPQTGGAWR
jgi:hypothetical protein